MVSESSALHRSLKKHSIALNPDQFCAFCIRATIVRFSGELNPDTFVYLVHLKQTPLHYSSASIQIGPSFLSGPVLLWHASITISRRQKRWIFQTELRGRKQLGNGEWYDEWSCRTIKSFLNRYHQNHHLRSMKTQISLQPRNLEAVLYYN